MTLVLLKKDQKRLSIQDESKKNPWTWI